MTHAEAIEKAQATNTPDVDIAFAEAAKNLVGKTLVSKDAKNTNRIEIVEWVRGSYIVRINGGDYNTSPVAWVLQNLSRLKVE